jgi:quinol monooxygenase YgiN
VFGSVFRLRPQPGKEGALIDMVDQWVRGRGAAIDGFVSLYWLQSRKHPGEIVGMTVFTSEAAYLRNAADPEQDRWFLGMRALLEAEPDWEDGDITGFPFDTPA